MLGLKSSPGECSWSEWKALKRNRGYRKRGEGDSNFEGNFKRASLLPYSYSEQAIYVFWHSHRCAVGKKSGGFVLGLFYM